jgi:AraC family transcriptional regulator, activator of mtrCDE
MHCGLLLVLGNEIYAEFDSLMMAGRRGVVAERIKVEAIMSNARSNDALSGLAPLLRVRPEIQDFCRFGGSWMSPQAQQPVRWAQFHIVTSGGCLVERKGRSPIALQSGDVLLLPHGDAHVIRSATSTATPSALQTTSPQGGIRTRSSINVQPDTELICGRLHFSAGAENLVSALPDAVHVQASARLNPGSYHMLMGSIRDELEAPRIGSLAIACDLASALFVMLIRNHLEQHAPASGLLRLLADRTTGRAVKCMIEQPSRDWTLDELAQTARTSRATLVRLFRNIGDIAPLSFLTELRLGLARQRIVAGQESLAQIAVDVGYRSEGALSRAMQRRHGIRPGSLKL